MDPGQHILIKDAIVFLFAAGVLVPLLRRAGVPSVIGFVLAGVVLGPKGLGTLVERAEVLRFVTITDTRAAAPFAELGVLSLLFLLGLELSFERLWSLRRVVFGAGGLQAGASAAAVGFGALVLGLPAAAAAVVGFALALSSTAIVMQLLIEERRAAGPLGRTALSVLLFQDLLVAPILIFVSFAAKDTGQGLASTIAEALLDGVLAIAVLVFAGRLLLERAFRLAADAGGRDVLMALSMLVVVGAAAITASAQLSAALGAFLAGIFLGETEFKHQTEVDLEPFKGILLGLFFMGVGMTLDLATAWRLLPAVAGGVVAVLTVKALTAWAACRLFAGRGSLAVETAALLAPAGEFAFVIVAAATAVGVLAPEPATLTTVIAGISMLSIPLMGRLGRRLAARIEDGAAEGVRLDAPVGLEGHVILAGFGRVGEAIARILSSEEAGIVALDRSPSRVAHERRHGWTIFLGDAARPEILERAGVRRAALVIVTVDDEASAESIVHAARSAQPDVPILARARDADHAGRLRQAGARFVIPDAVEAGLQLAGCALEQFGYVPETVRDRLAAERDAEYRKASPE